MGLEKKISFQQSKYVRMLFLKANKNLKSSRATVSSNNNEITSASFLLNVV